LEAGVLDDDQYQRYREYQRLVRSVIMVDDFPQNPGKGMAENSKETAVGSNEGMQA
jgi:hypothetical protein